MREPLLLGEAEPSATASDALSEAIRRADLTALWRAIDALPVPQREALLLREFGGLSYEELAAALAVSLSAVESLLFRARRGLRERLSEAYAGVAGAGWVEALGRLFAGGSGAAAPVAAKAVAVGAAVVVGGAVVAPDMLQHRAPARPVAAHARPAVRKARQDDGRRLRPDGAAAAREPCRPRRLRPVAQPVVFAVRTRKTRSSGDHHETGDDGGHRRRFEPSLRRGRRPSKRRRRCSAHRARRRRQGPRGKHGRRHARPVGSGRRLLRRRVRELGRTPATRFPRAHRGRRRRRRRRRRRLNLPLPGEAGTPVRGKSPVKLTIGGLPSDTKVRKIRRLARAGPASVFHQGMIIGRSTVHRSC